MRIKNVKSRIFISNTVMVLVILVIFLFVNAMTIHIFLKSVKEDLAKEEFRIPAKEFFEEEGDLGELLERVENQHKFAVLFLLDGLVCIGVLLAVSRLFTKNLADHIMKPLDALSEGACRVRGDDLTQDIVYEGDAEFENVCRAFNDMQKHILTEQEKNRKYEKARTDMIAGISHDLRTPLTAIRGTVKGMLDGVASTPKLREKFLETAYRRTVEMDALLNQLFYFSRMETGNMPLELKKTELAGFVREYVRVKQDLLPDGKGKTELIFAAEEAHYYARVDPEQMQRILDNLLENSRKYAGADPLKIRIGLEKKNGALELCFADNGEGIAQEKLPHVFEEFYRGDESRNRREGNGLGLYIVKYLAEAMGGSVRAEIRSGFAVTISLPEESGA